MCLLSGSTDQYAQAGPPPHSKVIFVTLGELPSQETSLFVQTLTVVVTSLTCMDFKEFVTLC